MVMLHEPWENADLIFSLFKYWDAEFDFEYPVYKVPYDKSDGFKYKAIAIFRLIKPCW